MHAQSTLDRTHGETTIRAALERFTEEVPADIDGLTWENLLNGVTRKLSYYLDLDVNWATIRDLAICYEDLAKVDNRTHPELEQNRAGTISNSLEILDAIEQQIEDLIRELVSPLPARRTEKLAA